VPDPMPWQAAWQRALYGPKGFYRQPGGPIGHFSTATHAAAGALLAEGLWRWADRLAVDGIVDVGAGRGELLRHLHAAAPDRPLLGLDVVGRPPGLPDAVGWTVSPGGADLPPGALPRRHLVVANEWLDVVPCVVGRPAPDGALREVLVDPGTGAETLGGPLSDANLQWCQTFWPSSVDYHLDSPTRVEVGRARDHAWLALLDRAGGGPAIAVDYGHTAADRPPAGTLTAYRSGREVDLVPDGSCDLTAHVAVDSLRQTGRLRQRDALDDVPAPDHGLARRDPAEYLARVARRSEAAMLRRPGGFGDFWWVVYDPGAQTGATSSRS